MLDAYHAFQSVNLVTAHDGFCLYDLVSYNRKHNLANGEEQPGRHRLQPELELRVGGGRRGGRPRSWRFGGGRSATSAACCSSPTARRCSARATSSCRRRAGNNNPYNQDNETTWLDWDLLKKNADIFRFFRMMIAFRKAHPSIGRSRFWREDVRWYGPAGEPDWGPLSAQLAYCLHGASQGDQDLYVMVNGGTSDAWFTVQEGTPRDWRRAFDTARPSPEDAVDPADAPPLRTPEYLVRARSVVVLVEGVETRNGPVSRRAAARRARRAPRPSAR